MVRRKPDLVAGAIAGVIGGVAYLAEMSIDRRVLAHNADDVALLGRMVTADPVGVRRIGTAMHLANSVVFGMTYALVAHDRLPGPAWLRGTTVATIENTLLYPLALIEDEHPGIRSGEIDRYWNRTAFLQGTIRHIAFGAVLGTAYAALRRS